MFRLEWLFLMQIIMGIFMLIFLQKLLQMKKQVEEIIKEITNYITFVTENEVKTASSDVFFEKQSTETGQKQRKNGSRKELETAQNQLIQAVLGEFFP